MNVQGMAPRSRTRSTVIVMLGVACMLLGGLGVRLLGHSGSGAEPAPLVVSLTTPRGIGFSLGGSDVGVPRLSPDGTMLAYAGIDARGRVLLYVRNLRTGESRSLQGTEGAQYHFWSPDSRSLGFFSGALYRIDVAGGPPRRLAMAPNGKGGSWNEDGIIVYTPNPADGLFRISADGGDPEALIELHAEDGDYSLRHPRFLPGGRALVYTRRTLESSRDLAHPEIWVATLDGTVKKKLVDSDANAIYAGGELLYVVDQTLLARPFDLATQRFTGEPRPVAQGVLVIAGARLGVFDATPDGALVFLQADVINTGRRIVRRDRTGAPKEVVFDRLDAEGLRLAANGTKLLTNIWKNENGTVETTLFDLESGARRVFENDMPAVGVPPITIDGDLIAYYERELPRTHVYVEPTSGFSTVREVATLDRNVSVTQFTADGSRLICFSNEPGGGRVAFTVTVDGSGEVEDLTFSGPVGYDNAVPSPDGAWYAVVGRYRGESSLYLAPTSRTEDTRRIPTPVEAFSPLWRADSSELFFLGSDGFLYAIGLSANVDRGDVELGLPTPLFDTGIGPGLIDYYAPMPDGESFLVAEPIETDAVQAITYMTDWRATTGLR